MLGYLTFHHKEQKVEQFSAKVIAHSVGPHDGSDIYTLSLVYPRFIHAEFMTHRVFSRNAASSRAIPVAKMIDQVRNNPAMPVHWGMNQPGMQARASVEGVNLDEAKNLWRDAAGQAANIARSMELIGLHKQVANRILEPFQLMSTLVTATDWENFFELRDHEDAQPEIRVLAQAMKAAMAESEPVLRRPGHGVSSWHLPYVTEEERETYRLNILLKLSTARCARVTHKNHDGSNPVVEKDIALHDALVGSSPIHASPTEHQATYNRKYGFSTYNFTDWTQYRYFVQNSENPERYPWY